MSIGVAMKTFETEFIENFTVSDRFSKKKAKIPQISGSCDFKPP